MPQNHIFCKVKLLYIREFVQSPKVFTIGELFPVDTNPETTELKNMIQQTNDLVLQLSKDVMSEISQMRGELNQMNERLGSFENRMGGLENRMNSLETRMSSFETRVESRISSLETRVESRITDIFKWMVGMMVPVWIGILVAIITQFIKG